MVEKEELQLLLWHIQNIIDEFAKLCISIFRRFRCKIVTATRYIDQVLRPHVFSTFALHQTNHTSNIMYVVIPLNIQDRQQYHTVTTLIR